MGADPAFQRQPVAPARPVATAVRGITATPGSSSWLAAQLAKSASSRSASSRGLVLAAPNRQAMVAAPRTRSGPVLTQSALLKEYVRGTPPLAPQPGESASSVNVRRDAPTGAPASASAPATHATAVVGQRDPLIGAVARFRSRARQIGLPSLDDGAGPGTAMRGALGMEHGVTATPKLSVSGLQRLYDETRVAASQQLAREQPAQERDVTPSATETVVGTWRGANATPLFDELAARRALREQRQAEADVDGPADLGLEAASPEDPGTEPQQQDVVGKGSVDITLEGGQGVGLNDATLQVARPGDAEGSSVGRRSFGPSGTELADTPLLASATTYAQRTVAGKIVGALPLPPPPPPRRDVRAQERVQLDAGSGRKQLSTSGGKNPSQIVGPQSRPGGPDQVRHQTPHGHVRHTGSRLGAHEGLG